MIEVENIREWIGRDVVDSDGDKVGTLEDVYFDAESEAPAFLIVKTGRIKHHLSFVPVEGAQAGPDQVQVGFPKTEIQKTPTAEVGGELSAEDESALYHGYGINYVPSGTESGRRLVRR